VAEEDCTLVGVVGVVRSKIRTVCDD